MRYTKEGKRIHEVSVVNVDNAIVVGKWIPVNVSDYRGKRDAQSFSRAIYNRLPKRFRDRYVFLDGHSAVEADEDWVVWVATPPKAKKWKALMRETGKKSWQIEQ